MVYANVKIHQCNETNALFVWHVRSGESKSAGCVMRITDYLYNTNSKNHTTFIIIIFSGIAAQRGLWSPRHTRFLDHTQRRATVGRTPLDE
jgi:hypothetical protein